MIPTIGRIVHYSLTPANAEDINRRRQHALTRAAANRGEGVTVHTGNDVRAGELYPMIITRVWSPGEEATDVNGQVFLDGNDTLWVNSVKQAKKETAGQFVFPEFTTQKTSA